MNFGFFLLIFIENGILKYDQPRKKGVRFLHTSATIFNPLIFPFIWLRTVKEEDWNVKVNEHGYPRMEKAHQAFGKKRSLL